MNASTALNGTGSVMVACTKGSSGLTVAMSNDVNVSGTQRGMLGATSGDFLNYNLVQPPKNTPGAACSFPGCDGLGYIGARSRSR